MQKPLNLKVVELEEELVKIINKSELPAFIIKPILSSINNQIIQLEQKQLEYAKAEYEEDLKKKEGNQK